MEITPEQQEQLTTWSAQRDEALKLLSVVNDEMNKKEIQLKDISESLTESEKRLIEINKSIELLDSQEELRINSVKKELSDLLIQKSILNTEITSIKSEIELIRPILNTEKDLLNTLSVANLRVKEQTEGLQGAIDYVTRNTEKAVNGINIATSEFKKEVSQSTHAIKHAVGLSERRLNIFSETTLREVREKLQKMVNNQN